MEIKYVAGPTGQKLHRSKAFFRAILGPIGSGKSCICVEELKRLALQQEPHNNVRSTRFAVVRNSYPELKSTTIKTWQQWFPDSICPITYDSPIRGKMVVRLPDQTIVDMEVFFVSMDKPSDVSKVLSMELSAIWFNEARELPKEIIDGGLGRIGRYPAKRDGGCTQKAGLADTNPPDDDHWWYRYAENDLRDSEEPADNWEFFQQPPALLKRNGKWIPNPDAENIEHLDGGYKYYLDQIGGKTKQWIQVYIEGKYGSIHDGDPVYTEFSDEIHVASRPLVAFKRAPLLLGVDFGMTPAVVVGQLTPRGQLLILHEFLVMQGRDKMDLKRFLKRVVVPGLRRMWPDHGVESVYADPAGQSGNQNDAGTCWQTLQEFGFDVDPGTSETRKNLVGPRLQAVNDRLTSLVNGQPAILISPTCQVLIKGFRGAYKYRRLQVAGYEERFNKQPDKNYVSHVHDALQYLAQGVSVNEWSKADVKPQHHVTATSAGY